MHPRRTFQWWITLAERRETRSDAFLVNLIENSCMLAPGQISYWPRKMPLLHACRLSGFCEATEFRDMPWESQYANDTTTEDHFWICWIQRKALRCATNLWTNPIFMAILVKIRMIIYRILIAAVEICSFNFEPISPKLPGFLLASNFSPESWLLDPLTFPLPLTFYGPGSRSSRVSSLAFSSPFLHILDIFAGFKQWLSAELAVVLVGDLTIIGKISRFSYSLSSNPSFLQNYIEFLIHRFSALRIAFIWWKIFSESNC